MPRWMLYGANGYTGQLIAEVAARRGLSPILAGRREQAIRPLAEQRGWEHRVFSLDRVEDIARELQDVDALLLAAGPFSRTSEPALSACLASGTHYLDITGEIAVFERCFARDDEAKRAGVVAMPGVGFDVVPSDCLAKSVCEAMPDATHLELAFAGGTMSRGTLKTMVEGLGLGGAVREDGRIRVVPTAHQVKEIPFRDKPRECVSIPWGDVSTAYRSTGMPNIVVYTAMPPRMIQVLQLARPALPLVQWSPVQHLLGQLIERKLFGPDEQTRGRQRVQLWARASKGDAAVEGTLVTPDGYTLTAETAVESTLRVAHGAVRPGTRTPSQAFGARYIREFDGCELHIGNR